MKQILAIAAIAVIAVWLVIKFFPGLFGLSSSTPAAS